MSSPPGFVVTGTGRCGTNYIARVLNAAGVRCGHEDWWGALPGFGEGSWIPRPTMVAKLRDVASRAKVEIYRRRRRLDGDSSWLAVPHLGNYDGIVLLQLRHPLSVIRSLVGSRLFSVPEGASPFKRKAQSFVARSGDEVTDAMRWWVGWNRWAARRADIVYHIEDLDARLLRLILEEIGGDPARAEAALASVPARTNTLEDRGQDRPELSWADLPEGPELEALEEATEAFGYDVPVYHS